MVGVPVQVPWSAMAVPPSSSAPEIDGAAVFAGAAGATGAVAADGVVLLPAAFAAVTATRIAWPTSAGLRSYVVPVAPAMATQFVPSASQRSHCRAIEMAGVPLQAPSSAPRVRVSCATPETEGEPVRAGAAGETTGVAADVD